MSGQERFVCIHGHFYQPPRENPWLGRIEAQESAAPFHDWNQRICAECYEPNSRSHRLDEFGNLVEMRNNYAGVSFNFGPTLLSWLEQSDRTTYAAILEADKLSAQRLGRGNALAQVYGHCILPLADQRDQVTQVRWGIGDFVERFGRRPDGMWLPETAVGLRSLRVLAAEGIRFTLLAPAQAARLRPPGGAWRLFDAAAGDTARPYRCDLGNGQSIVLFFYDGDISHEIAFGGLLHDGRELARRLAEVAREQPLGALVHIATDGESYGHHHRFGDMALAAALWELDHDETVRLTNYAAYLDHVPVTHEVEIHENTSWSCAHGIERWRAHCGCNAGHPDWQQAWRRPLRDCLAWLKRRVDQLYEEKSAGLLRDPWSARDAYIDVVVRPTQERRHAFLAAHASPGHEASRVWEMLELEHNAMLTFTSCGWFFDDPAGLETVQILTYAARTLETATSLGCDLVPEFLQRLREVQSNDPRYPDGEVLYQQLVCSRIPGPLRSPARAEEDPSSGPVSKRPTF